MKRYASLCFLLFVSMKTTAEHHPFRTDYEYNAKTKSFYKLHIETKRYSGAETACKDEGASLMVPFTEADKSQLHAMMKKFPFIGNLVYLGKNNLSGSLQSAEEMPIIDLEPSADNNDGNDYNLEYTYTKDCQVQTRENEVRKDSCWANLPFACKVEESKLTYDTMCDTYVSGYTYHSEVRSCYKPSTNILIWAEAGAECNNQGGHLVVLNSEAEHQVVKEVLRAAPSLIHSLNPIYVLAGISAKAPSREFRTIFNETLEQAGYSTWNEGEPNNEGGEYCGSLGKANGFYNDIPCYGRFGYLCEREISRKQ